MNYFQERVSLLQNSYASPEDPVAVYKQLITQKYLNRPKDFFEGQSFMKEFHLIASALKIQHGGVVTDLRSLELRGIASRLQDIHQILSIVLEYITERATFFYHRYCVEKDKSLSENIKGYCRSCRQSLVVEKIKKENRGLTQISLGRLEVVREEAHHREEVEIYSPQWQTDQIESTREYIRSIKTSQTASKLSQILQGSERYTSDKKEKQHDYDGALLIVEFQEQRKRVKGMVQRRNSSVWTAPRVVVASILREERGVQTQSWEYQNIKQTLILEKQGVRRALVGERQKSEGYLHSMRKQKVVLDDQVKQIGELEERGKELNRRIEEQQGEILKLGTRIEQLQRDRVVMNKSHQQLLKEKVEMAGEFINMQILYKSLKEEKEKTVVPSGDKGLGEKRVNIKSNSKVVSINNSSMASSRFISIAKENKENRQEWEREKREAGGETREDRREGKSIHWKSEMEMVRNPRMKREVIVKEELGTTSPGTLLGTPEPSVINHPQQNERKQKRESILNRTLENQNDFKIQSLIIPNSFESSPARSIKQISHPPRPSRKEKLSKTICTQNNQKLFSKPLTSQFSLKKLKKYCFKSRQNSPRLTKPAPRINQRGEQRLTDPQKSKGPNKSESARRGIVRNTTIVFPVRSPQESFKAHLSTHLNEQKGVQDSIIISSRKIIEGKEQRPNISSPKDEGNSKAARKSGQKLRNRHKLKLDIRPYVSYEIFKEWLQRLECWYSGSINTHCEQQFPLIEDLMKLIKQLEYFEKHRPNRVPVLKSYLSRFNCPSSHIIQTSKFPSTHSVLGIIRFFFTHKTCVLKESSGDKTCSHVKELMNLLN